MNSIGGSFLGPVSHPLDPSLDDIRTRLVSPAQLHLLRGALQRIDAGFNAARAGLEAGDGSKIASALGRIGSAKEDMWDLINRGIDRPIDPLAG